MNDIRELLTLAARAMGLTGRVAELYGEDSLCFIADDDESVYAWLTDSGDSHDMCAALGIDTEWGHPIRPPREIVSVSCVSGDHYAIERLKDHNNSRAAAWRLAALRVAAAIGKGMQG